MEVFIIFEGPIDPPHTVRLMDSINQAINSGSEKINIFFSSTGGSIYHGFLLASLIQNSKVPISIHATNHVDSIANIVFLAAKERTSESHSLFYLHGASAGGNFDQRTLIDRLSSIKADNGRIAQFIAENSRITLRRVRNMMDDGTTLSAREAMTNGLVVQIVHKEIPPSSPRTEIITVIN